MKVDVFIPCCIDQFSPQTGFNVIKLLEKCGIETHYNPSQTCCGELFYRKGDFESAQKLASHFMDLFDSSEYIVGASAACIAFVKYYFEDLFFNTSNHNRYKTYTAKSFDFADFLVNKLGKTDVGAVFNAKAVLVEDRGIKGIYNLRKELMMLLGKVKNLEIIESVKREVIPGSDFIFPNRFEPISTEIIRQFIEAIKKAGADTIISNDNRTLLNIESYTKKYDIPVQCIHIIDVLAHE